ncbi:MAG: tRNA modification GTPase MnmE [Pseudomonadota bacterium]|jgi:tRNA modification GTPase
MKTPPIAAIATAPGRGGVGIVRLSGTGLKSWIEPLTGKVPSDTFAAPRVTTLTPFIDTAGQAIDEGLLIYFTGPNSFTGEDVIELHGHGGPVVMQLLLGRCLDLGARLAEPGEFTRRAFINGKLDLAQAEAVADLINASTATAARSAVRSLQGDFSRAIDALMQPLIELRALTEATLDFPEEEVDFLKSIQAETRLQNIREALGKVQASAKQGKLLHDGLTVVLIGQPNVGKSSLLNVLAGEDLAIVTPVAGTTRDVVRAHLQIEGVPLHVIDTAGLHDTSDEVERLGIERTWKEIEKADVAVLLTDAQHGLTPAEQDIINRLPEGMTRVTVQNKIDLGAASTATDALQISAKTGLGIELLRAKLLEIAGWQPGESLFIARERHLRALSDASDHLNTATAALPALEIFAEELRLAHKALQSITGEYTPEDLLGDIFSRFCIGK